MGGTAEGITSGLSRQGYATNEDNLVKKNDFLKMKASDLGDMTFGEMLEASKAVGYKPRGTNVYDFMTEFGLDIASRSPVPGGILATAATSAKEPYQRFMERKQSAAEQEYGSESDLFKTMIDAQSKVLAAGKEGEGKNWLEQWKFEQIPILNDTIDRLTKLQDKGPLSDEDALDLKNAIDQKSRIVTLDPITEAFLKTEYGGFMVVDMMDELLNADKKLPPEERKYTGKKDIKLALDAIAEVRRQFRQRQAEGGRAGYQMGGGTGSPSIMNRATTDTEVEDAYGVPVSEAVPATAGPIAGSPSIMNRATTDTEVEDAYGVPVSEAVPEELQNIDYDTLRARLPSSITDDIVRLIANSAEAMEDFAMIQTQQDINNFNKKYGVELVLPAEA
jgi:hypothetical protein